MNTNPRGIAASFCAFAAACLCGCSFFPSPRALSLGEQFSGYTYVPVDPIAIEEQSGRYCEGADIQTLRSRELDFRRQSYMNEPPRAQSGRAQSGGEAEPIAVPVFRRLLESFPDNAVRISVEQYDASGKVSYGPSSIGSRGERYKVTVDYINADTTTIPLLIQKTTRGAPVGVSVSVPPQEPVEYIVRRAASDQSSLPPAGDFELFNVPLYIGLGLRVTADISVLSNNAKIEGLGIIGAEAEAGNLSGSLVVQTLGVNGKSISAALPIQSELNRTTAQNAVVAIGSIKALLYEGETVVSPRVVGLYLPFPGGKDLVNKIISVLAEQPIPWKRPCVRAVDEAGSEKAIAETPKAKAATKQPTTKSSS